MQCPLCASELGSNAVNCEKCGATRVTQRSPMGVLVGWVGIVVGLLWLMLGVPLLILPFIDHGIGGYPWSVFIVGGIIAAGLLWYSKTTVHTQWTRQEDGSK